MSDKLTHLEHLEDYVLVSGASGISMIVDYLKAIRDELVGHSTKKINTTIKYDGAPSLVAGIDPADGRFFVAKKSVFNKNPKVYKTPAEIEADTSGDLADKLKLALKYLPATGIKGVVQGDFMFGGDVRKERILGADYITFHPNTIVYAVPAQSELAKKILKAKIGVVWHTMYTGNSLQDMKAVGGQRIASKLKQTKDVWFDDVVMDVSGTATLTAAETSEVSRSIEAIQSAGLRAAPAMAALASSPELLALLKTYHNSRIRSGKEQVGDGQKYLWDFRSYIDTKFQADAEKLKTEKGKAGVELKKKAATDVLDSVKESDWTELFSVVDLVIQAKEALIQKLDRLTTMNTFLKTVDGFQVTKQEGYVITDHLGKNAVKLVDRLGFSKANFSPTVLKGFMR